MLLCRYHSTTKIGFDSRLSTKQAIGCMDCKSKGEVGRFKKKGHHSGKRCALACKAGQPVFTVGHKLSRLTDTV